MDQVIIYTNEKGWVTITIPTGEIPIEQVLQKDCPDGAIIKNRADVPFENIDFHEAWELAGESIKINLNKAKEIKKNLLRNERTALFVPLDIAYQRNLETGTDNSNIVAEKQRLRDITKLADKVVNLEQLRNIKI